MRRLIKNDSCARSEVKPVFLFQGRFPIRKRQRNIETRPKIREPIKTRRSLWEVPSISFPERLGQFKATITSSRIKNPEMKYVCSSITIRTWTAALLRPRHEAYHRPKALQRTGNLQNSKPSKPVTARKNKDKRRMRLPWVQASESECVPSSPATGSKPKWMTWDGSRHSDWRPTTEVPILRWHARSGRVPEQESWRSLANRINQGSST